MSEAQLLLLLSWLDRTNLGEGDLGSGLSHVYPWAGSEVINQYTEYKSNNAVISGAMWRGLYKYSNCI